MIYFNGFLGIYQFVKLLHSPACYYCKYCRKYISVEQYRPDNNSYKKSSTQGSFNKVIHA